MTGQPLDNPANGLANRLKRRYERSVLLDCKQCGRAFKAEANQLRTSKGKFCSKDCGYQFRRQNRETDRAPEIQGDIAVVRLAQGQIAVIDAADAALVGQRSWSLNRKGYAVAFWNRRTVTMHRFILGLTDRGTQVDHANRNKLDNRRSNLRPCTPLQNSGNSAGWGSASVFKGVTRTRSKTNPWQARCAGIFLGKYPTEEDAARAFDDCARQRYGAFAYLNFPAHDSALPAKVGGVGAPDVTSLAHGPELIREQIHEADNEFRGSENAV